MGPLSTLVILVFSYALGVYTGYKLNGSDKIVLARRARAEVHEAVMDLDEMELDRQLRGVDNDTPRRNDGTTGL